jgi:hypothetical protein
VHLPDAEQLISTASAKGASFHLEWALSCMKMYPQYEHLYWDHSAARTLLERVSTLLWAMCCDSLLASGPPLMDPADTC